MFNNKEQCKEAITGRLKTQLGKGVEKATERDVYKALSSLLQSEIMKQWKKTNDTYRTNKDKQVYYFSMEFLMGRLLGNNMLNMKVIDVVDEALKDLGFSLTNTEDQEKDAGLGNGGLGRLAACFLDSLASLGIAGHGYGIRYKYGMFDQRIVDGYQVELPDHWLNEAFAWEVRRPEEAVEVRFEGRVTSREREDGQLDFHHEGYETLQAVPYDVPVVGYNGDTINTLRLWSAEPSDKDIMHLAHKYHDYSHMLGHQRTHESISDILYPDDSTLEGQKLRLKQEYFFVSAGLQSAIKKFEQLDLSWDQLPHKAAFHINDTHPALIVPELMRILMDEKQLSWNKAWDITLRSVSYTNHTILSEALEMWPIDMFRAILPRIFMIIEEINNRFCHELWTKHPGDYDRIGRLAIIADGQVKMAHLAIVGSHSINGVAKLHTEILKKREMKYFFGTFPERFNNKTNGITHRRWLMHANKPLSNVITDVIGDEWKRQPTRLLNLLKYQEDASLLDNIYNVKQHNKESFSDWLYKQSGIMVDPTSVFDVHIKRLHGYKRQLLNALHIMYLYNEMKANRTPQVAPRTFFFGAKAAPSYHFAKKVIKLINTIATVVNNDPDVNDQLKVVFLENYSVSIAEKIIPATNVSEQISTASKEASGTGNMKLMMNGALTLGTMDGANVEIYEQVGEDNIYTFGLRSDEVLKYEREGGYVAKNRYHQDERIRHTVDQLIHTSPFSDDGTEFKFIYDALLTYNDEYFVLKDFSEYIEKQKMMNRDYKDVRQWSKKSLVNIAHSGAFSSDSTIEAYANDIWNVKHQQVVLK
ncbi:glycogen/starch/alpha-glucan phosphorylase [Pontibacillus litoralis]|uniref:Alpha-1,4 glucan phosphorylase n=1 Tax=Pontibacillus litoralis JSM 072002 TaxID=1385512 RepID=A0A0A5G4N0_9BACI|nr:glycogen/starch/alpha-glucan phosphorylase [Pontibacillus litoralis]KGX86108.1 glycogen phosphorylase [Pontibacillus litoralis JSM 072002]